MRVLVTGGSGFIAAHIVDELVKRGHSVVFTVRSDEKGQKILQNHSGTPSSQLSYVIVKDISEEGAFDEAVKSDPPFEAVLHTASPFHYNVTDPKKDLIDPAVNGTTSILKAVKKFAPTVKRIVITSSFAAILNLNKHEKVYSEASWNPITEEEAVNSPTDAYRASKTFAEKAAWEFVEKEKPNFDIATINPPLVFGPVVHYLNSLDAINTSNARIRDMIQGKFKDGLPPSGVYLWVDVRDVALAHVKAMETPAAGGKRFFVTAGYMTNGEIAQIIKDKFPQFADKLPEKFDTKLPEDVYGYDNSRSKEVLGLEYRKLEETIVDTVNSLLAVGA
ncbi:methylglyoxal reductase (NADPH-dependent) gre2 [Exophiala dermatitidis]|uniref:Methylglyoxal reductase (NADPH-dependent) gre2 n=1 Tax=Exophiala dermatitidis TaxID=5970 RepID=A0AAN6F413_EXODE|nr:methylglyoxal reductase (NADPH-dependent) gre2 [Exophiala dermatitidis]KAJ4523271.1 methylglyoxal reductase (NADPH-dependent) gre2 [Exophiala dermatitidis]KAJ4526616.1 methylglyoxal reductase (NADPH-dependent) gre2 [Exophiala dermatitidis]KAJ4532136.1 methylglyoxal reductase (NADPH-dependent) gre2 [Exophiala dermatitidis]KAJ4546171.1 methylglyoxal reductase (NADPH-dependent) gre2 [Exophiala dermatitidis]